ncbi:MAG: ABC transporter permease [Prevotella sp.]|nr:ABC transporter permease [Prevotella sp.]MDY4037935.1 FtsX-like permease family protein [Prevotella sp.]
MRTTFHQSDSGTASASSRRRTFGLTANRSLGLAVRNLFRRGQHNAVKILCLALGLSVSAVIIAEIYYEQTFDQCYPDHGRICRVTEGFKMKAQEFTEGSRTSGGVAPLMKRTIPQVELATRINPIMVDGEVETDDRTRVRAHIYLADSCFFRLFPARILAGNADKALTEPFCCAVNRTTAERLGGNVIGRRIESDEMPGLKMTVMAVYEDYPHNSTFHDFDVIGSLSTQRNFSYDGQDNLVGNDRYYSFVRLREGMDPEAMAPLIRRMMQTHYPVNELKQAGVELTYKLTPISRYFTGMDQIRQMAWILSLLAFVMLSASVLNYVLIVVGNLVTRAREMAVRKCYGAGPAAVYAITFGEALLHLVLALLLGGLLLWACHGTVEQLLSAPLSVLVFNRGAWILAVIILTVLFVGGIVPGWLYNRMPVAIAFQGYVEARRRWKAALLGLEFAMVSFFLGLLWIISMQYQHMIGYDLGYQCRGIAVVDVTALTPNERQTAADEVARMGGVRRVSACNSIPFYGASGNNVTVPGENEQLFNISDFYTVADHYFDMMRIPVIAGRVFAHNSDSLHQVMVSESFASMMRRLREWNDVVGRKVIISEHSGPENKDLLTIVGVYRDIHIGGAENNAYNRPSVMFYGRVSHGANKNLLIQLTDFSAGRQAEIQTRLQRFFPDKTVVVKSMENEKNLQYQSMLHFRDGVTAESLIILFIALMGLVGYVSDEVNRRHREIAIRKVNGARMADVMRIFLTGILRTAVPAVLVGAFGAYWVAGYWLQLYENRITLTVWPFAVTVVLVLLIVVLLVAANCMRVARSNPVDYLKTE